MKKTILSLLTVALTIGLSSFATKSLNYEQIAFDYFISDILKRDLTDLSAIEFKGKTEESFSNLGTFKFCLKPEEKLQSLIDGATKGPSNKSKEIIYDQVKNVTITDFTDQFNSAKLYVYHGVRVADNYYVFLSIQKQKKAFANYVFEVNPDGTILRSCRMT